MMLTLSSSFSSAHFYHQPAWSDDKNREVFGRCFTPYGHGHNYILSVKFYVTAETLTDDQRRYQDLLQELTQTLDHEHLNFVIPEFKQRIPTTENIALYFLDQLQAQLPITVLHSIRLQETDTLWTEILL